MTAQLYSPPPMTPSEAHKREFEYDHKLLCSRPTNEWEPNILPANLFIHSLRDSLHTHHSVHVFGITKQLGAEHHSPFHPGILALCTRGLLGHFDGCFPPTPLSQ